MKNSRSGTRRTRLLASLTGGAALLALALPAFADEPASKQEAAAKEQKAPQPPVKELGKKGTAEKKPGPHGEKGHGEKKPGPHGEKGHGEKKPGPHGEKKGGGLKDGADFKKPKRLAVPPREAMKHYRTALDAFQEAEGPERMKAHRALSAARKEMSRAHRKEAREIKKDLKKIRTALKEKAKERRANRKERMAKHRETLKKELGEVAQHAPVRAELIRHAWRMARLERLLAIAEAAGREKAVERATTLIEKEEAQHPERLAKAKKQKAEVKAAKAGAKTEKKADKAPAAAPAAAPAPATEGAEQ